MIRLTPLVDRTAASFAPAGSRDANRLAAAAEGAIGREPVGLGRDALATASQTAGHLDGRLAASDGQALAYRTSEVSGAPKAIVVMQQGTLGKPEYFDAMGEAFARSGIKSYALGSRTVAPKFQQHADDLDALVRRARAENPGVPVTVMGVSLGAMIALDWSARHNADKLPVAALAPVVLSRFLSLGENVKVAESLVSQKARKTLVNTPMSAGVPLTSNPASPEFQLAGARQMKVPAGLFGDVMKMTGEVATHGHAMQGPLYLALGGADRVAVNGASSLYAKLIRSSDKTVREFPGVSHDMSQETNHPELVSALQDFVLAPR